MSGDKEMPMTDPNELGTESELQSNYSDIEQYYGSKVKLHRCMTGEKRFLSIAEITGSNFNDDEEAGRNTLIIVAGRGENEHKYAELLYRLRDTPLRICVCFVRGQGHSSTDLEGSNKCHISTFDSYRQDIRDIIEYIDPKPGFRMMGFSLGGLIITDFTVFNDTVYKPAGVALIAPFLGVNYHVPNNLLYAFISAVCKIPSLSESYTPYGQDYRRIAFAENYHSHSVIRYSLYHDYYAQYPEETIGGPTFGFVKSCMEAQRRLMKSVFELPCPFYCQSAELDKVVHSGIARDFFEKHGKDRFTPKFNIVRGAFHDILNESDDHRNLALYKAFRFLFPHVFKGNHDRRR